MRRRDHLQPVHGNVTPVSMSQRRKALFILSGLIPVLGLFSRPPSTASLIYSVFVGAWFLRPRLKVMSDRLPGPPGLYLILFFIISGSLTETFAWLNNYLERAQQPALFHPQLIADLIVGVGFYGAWAIAWLLALRWFRFTLAEAFLVTGIQGIFFEQLGAVFMQMLAVILINPLQALLFGLFVCAVHGSAVGLALTPILHRFDEPSRSQSWVRFAVVSVLMVGLAFVGTALVEIVMRGFGGLPPKRSIVEHPFW